MSDNKFYQKYSYKKTKDKKGEYLDISIAVPALPTEPLISKEKDENLMDIDAEVKHPNMKGEFENIKTDGEIYSIAMNEKGIIVIGDGEDTTYFIDANKKEIIKKEKLNKDSVTSIDVSSDGKYLVTGSLDGNAHIFETENFTVVNTVNGSFSEINVIYIII